MAKRQRSAVENYHDRVAGLYDTIYSGDAYWEVVFAVTWKNILRHLPKDHSTRCLDVGCGTGRWGGRLLKAGYRVDFLDISRKMLDQVGKKLHSIGKSFLEYDTMAQDNPLPPPKPAESGMPILWQATVDDLSTIPKESYGFLVGQGDPLNCAQRPERAFKEMTRILAPGGVMVMSVDNRLQGIYHYFQTGDIAGLKEFLSTGRTKWITDNPAEQYPITMFTPKQIKTMCEARGLELLGLIGKTVLPLRRFRELLADREKRDELIRLEESLHADEALFANAAHLEFAVRKPMTGDAD